jgi:hypothetical protein
VLQNIRIYFIFFVSIQAIFGNISSVIECDEWFKCTYLYHRMRSRAMELGTDLSLAEDVQILVLKALEVLEKAGMICFLCLGTFRSTGEDLCVWETI